MWLEAGRRDLAVAQPGKTPAVDVVGKDAAVGAASGQTNPEIGALLFLGPRTVEWHLSKIFGKLGVSSRKELRAALSDVGAAVVRL